MPIRRAHYEIANQYGKFYKICSDERGVDSREKETGVS